jgi:hypothetical protein
LRTRHTHTIPESSKSASGADRKRLTFAQAEGAEPLPSQLRLKEVSQRLRSRLWLVIYGFLEGSTHRFGSRVEFFDDWDRVFFDLHVHFRDGFADDYTNDAYQLTAAAKQIVAEGDYIEVFGWIQFVLRHPSTSDEFKYQMGRALEDGRAAYRVVDGDTICPIGTEGDADTVKRAFADLTTSEFNGARQHLRQAAEELTAGNCADSICESIHAVESVVRVLEPDPEFSRALAKLEPKVTIHGALKRGFNALYGFTSDEKGIRHPLLDKDSATVDETDALFMIGACAAFVSYLVNKSRAAGLL